MKDDFNILLIVHSLSSSGAIKVAIETFENFPEKVSVYTLALEDGAWKKRFSELGPVQVMSDLPFLPPRLAKRLLPFLPRGLPFRLNSRLIYPWRRRQKPAVVYVNSIASLPLLAFLKLEDIPVLLHVHELEVPLRMYERYYAAWLLERPTRYLAVSAATKRDLIKCGVPAEKIVVVHPFVQEKAGSSVPAADKTNATPNPAQTSVLIGGAGELNWCKGNQLWLLMAAELTQLLGRDGVRFAWVGVRDNDEGLYFRYMTRQLGLEGLVEFIPHTSEPLKQYARFDVFAMTSWEESASLVVLENMLLEKPVVCFAGSGGPPELVGDTGIIVEQFNPRTMAQAIALLAKDPHKRASLGQAARDRVKKGFVPEVQAAKVLHAIRDTMQSKPAPSERTTVTAA